MQTAIIKNVSGATVEISVYTGVNSSVRRKVLLVAGDEIRANRIPPETRALVDRGKLDVQRIAVPLPDPPATAPSAFIVDPLQDLTFSGHGYGWPAVGAEPIPIDYATNIRRFVANDKFALLAPNRKQNDVDIDWWNCHRGPHFSFKNSFEGDFLVTVDIEADNGIGPHDWAGILAVSAVNPFRFARLGIGLKDGVGPVFERVFHAGYDVSDAFFTADEIGVCDEGGPFAWEEIAGGRKALTGLISRVVNNSQQTARLLIKRAGPLLYLTGDDFSNTEKAQIVVQNFLEGPVVIMFAIGRYPSLGSRFQGASFHNVQGIATKS